MRIVIAPDKFKGSLAAPLVAEAIARGVRRAAPDAQVVCVPMADGGEGIVEALIAATGGSRRAEVVEGPLGEAVRAGYGFLGDGAAAVIEMAAASGLVLLEPARRDPFATSTFGTGQLLLAAISEGATRVIIGIGGSATNDCGAGLGAALGYRFFDSAGLQLTPRGAGSLRSVARIESSDASPLLDRATIDVACDVDNPLCGSRGASAVFGPQKFAPEQPATPEKIAELDDALAHFASLIERDLGVDVKSLPGAGAAGGLGGGLVAFAHGRLTPGVDLVIDAVGLRAHLEGANLCLTGEGAIDASSAGGKTVVGVARLARSLGVPTIALAGKIGDGADAVLGEGIAAYFSICDGPMPLEVAVRDTERLLAASAEQVVRAFLLSRHAESY